MKRSAPIERRTGLKTKVRRATAIPYPLVHADGCWFVQIPGAGSCDGALVRCHLLPKQLLRRRFPHGFQGRSLAQLQADPRSWVWGCGGTMGDGGHHGRLDTSRKLKIPRVMLPAGVEEMAAELALTWWLDREYGELAEALVA